MESGPGDNAGSPTSADDRTPAVLGPASGHVTHIAAFFDLSAEAMGLARDGRYILVNPAFARLFAYGSPDDLIGLAVLENFAEDERPRILDYQRRRAAGEPLPATYLSQGLRRDGTTFDAELRVFGFREAGSQYTAAVVRDVTEARRLEGDLRASERRFRDLFEFVPVSLWEVDASAIRARLDHLRAEGIDLRAWLASHERELAELVRAFKIVSINAYGCLLAGGRTQEEVVANLDSVEIPEAATRYVELGLQLLDGLPIARAEGWSGTVRGERKWVETAMTALPGHEKTWSRLVFASVDVTERRRAEEERSALHERLRQSEKLEVVGRLAGGIAHDFNNVLAAILSYAELTALGLQPGTELHDHQERIREAALRARALVRQILTFSRRDSANQRVVDVPGVVAEALSLMRAGIPSTVALETRIDPDAGATLADPTQIHQVVLNLCSNARDAVGTYGRIEVELSSVEVGEEIRGLSPGRYVRLRVRDDGVGMDEATQARIFEPYMTTKGPFGGHGLGLPVVHGIVTGAGGAIHVESTPQMGSTFDVYLPRRASQGPEPEAARRTATGRGERILVVEDEPLVRKAIRRQLESLGYVVEEVEDGQQALERFRGSPGAFDLVVTDQTMPNLAGADLARALLALRPGLPIVLCTGYSDRIDEAGARALGLKALLMKPVDRETMATVLREALGR